MGYSCSAKADEVFKAMEKELGCGINGIASNAWKYKAGECFTERGKENRDGAITGQVFFSANPKTCKAIGSFRIDADGKIVRFAASSKSQKKSAMIAGLVKYHEAYEPGWDNDKLLRSLIGNSNFVVI